MSVSIKYKGEEIASASTEVTKTIKTAGKYCEDDILVENTPDGGGGGNPTAPENDVILIDYDGTIRYSYTAAEFLALTELPSNPTHEGLTSEGWNWSLAGAQAYVRKYGEHIIGATYSITDGATHVGVSVIKGATLKVTAKLYSVGSASIDWGDGTAPTSFDESVTDYQSFTHTYTDAGEYDIAIAHTKSLQFSNSPAVGRIIQGDNSANSLRSAVDYIFIDKRMAIGSSWNAVQNYYNADILLEKREFVSLGSYMQYTCSEALVLPIGYTAAIGNSNWFGYSRFRYISFPEGYAKEANGVITGHGYRDCNALKRIVPDDISINWGSSALLNCYSLEKINIPECVSSIAASVFSNCYSLNEIRFFGTTPPTVANANAFSGVPTSCKIYVPRGCLEAYTTATNYPDSTAYTYEEFDIPT